MKPREKGVPQPLSDEVREDLPGDAQEYIDHLEDELEKAKREIEKAKKEIERLNGLFRMNSQNSSKPPSSDGLKKPTIPSSQRRPSGKRPGGQPGHKGATLGRRKHPDKVIRHSVVSCECCKKDLSGQGVVQVKSCQVFDIPKPQVTVTEHLQEVKICNSCGTKNSAALPPGITGAGVEYGPNIKAFGIFLMHEHLVPARRTSDIMSELLGVHVSIGSLAAWSTLAFSRLDSFEQNVIARLIQSPIVNFDETGMRCERKLHWLHSASTKALTFFGIHAKRGVEAMNAFKILPLFRGTAVHDHWDPYFTYENCEHALCNTHILRELTFIEEVLGEKWAAKMKALLKKIHRRVERAKEKGKRALSMKQRTSFLRKYEKILKEGFSLHRNDPVPAAIRRGRVKQTKGKNLLDRLRDFNLPVLRFMHDFRVPFTNNRGEQDIRMNKVKLKISGCFRSFEGARVFCRIRGYLSTMKKLGGSAIDACLAVFLGQPLLLPAAVPE